MYKNESGDQGLDKEERTRLTFVKHDAVQYTAVGQLPSRDFLYAYVSFDVNLGVLPSFRHHLLHRCDGLQREIKEDRIDFMLVVIKFLSFECLRHCMKASSDINPPCHSPFPPFAPPILLFPCSRCHSLQDEEEDREPPYPAARLSTRYASVGLIQNVTR